MSTKNIEVRRQNQPGAILLIHGFGGEPQTTFGMMPAFLAGSDQLTQWDIHCFGYPTSLSPDVTGVWAADPDLTTLAGLLSTSLDQLQFREYKQLVLVGHSMGGLIIQRALLEGEFRARVKQVVLFGTPSNGLKKAWWGKLWKRQARDMVAGGEFITGLRQDWKRKFGNKPPFGFRVVAGVRDEFVPRESSVDVFPAEQRNFLPGNHLEMVKPETAGGESIQLLEGLLSSKGAAPAAPVPVMPAKRSRREMDEAQLEELVYRLEAQGEWAEAIQLLEERVDRSTNLDGVLAGRLKRRWFTDPEARAAEGERAQALYARAYERAVEAGDHGQAFYLGINDAFMALALGKSRAKARVRAERVLAHTAEAKGDAWALPTKGEAYLYLGETEKAMAAYREAAQEDWTPRERASITRQAIWVARLTKNLEAEERLWAVLPAGE